MRTNQNQTKPLWAFIPAILLMLAMGAMPDAYYQFAHIVVCGCALMMLGNNYRDFHRLNIWGYCFILIAVLFNPIMPYHFDRIMWVCMDMISASCFIGYASRAGAERDEPIVVCAAAR